MTQPNIPKCFRSFCAGTTRARCISCHVPFAEAPAPPLGSKKFVNSDVNVSVFKGTKYPLIFSFYFNSKLNASIGSVTYDGFVIVSRVFPSRSIHYEFHIEPRIHNNIVHNYIIYGQKSCFIRISFFFFFDHYVKYYRF